MADRRRSASDNQAGSWFVDDTCIDCGICRWVAPRTFGDGDDHAYVAAQPPEDDPELQAAAGRAAVACPVGSIGGPADAVRAAARSFPSPVLPDVWFCGWASRETYGAAAWLLRHPAGNVLVDVPRPSAQLLSGIEALGGVRTMVLTHRDDIAGHTRFADHFGAERHMHVADLGPETQGVEHPVSAAARLANDLLLLPLPGHTRGSMGLLWGDKVLFSGDHVWGAGALGWHAEGRSATVNQPLGAGRSVCWWSWPQQIASMERLLDHPFQHVLPGHGRPWHGGEALRVPALQALIGWMKDGPTRADASR